MSQETSAAPAVTTSDASNRVSLTWSNRLLRRPDFAAAVAAVAAGRPVVIHCKVGGRSAEATGLALAAGLTDVASLDGGVLAWVREVDPSQPEY